MPAFPWPYRETMRSGRGSRGAYLALAQSKVISPVNRRRDLRSARVAASIERIFVVASLLTLCAISFIVGSQPCCGPDTLNPLLSLETSSTAGDFKKQAVLLCVYAFSAIFAVTRFRPRAFLFLGGPLSLLIGWCFASIMWSTDADLSLRRCVALGGTVFFGLYIGLRFDFKDLLRLISWVIAIILVGSLLVAAVAPLNGFDYEGRLRGVFDHKNDLANFSALALLVSTALLFGRHDERRALLVFDIFIAVLCIVALSLAGSASPVPVLAFSLVALVLAHVMRSAGRWLIALVPLLIAVGITAAALLALNMPTLAHLLDRSSDLSGRTKVWAFSLKMIFERPFEGYGYGAFWAGADSPGAVFWHVTHLAVPHAHNGYLQLLLDAGAVGLALALAAIVSAFIRLAGLLRYDRLTPVPWAVAYLCFLLATQITEPGIWTGNSLLAVLFVAVVVQSNVLARRTACSHVDVPVPLDDVGSRHVLNIH